MSNKKKKTYNSATARIIKQDEQEARHKRLFTYALIGVLAVIFLNLRDTYNFATDDSYNLYEISSIKTNSRVVSLRKMSRIPKDKWDLAIKEFTRDVITRLYPRTSREVRPSFEWLFNHTLPNSRAASRYAGFLDDIEEFELSIDMGTVVTLMPIDNFNQVRARKIDGQYGSYYIEVPMWKYSKSSSSSNIEIVTFRLKVKVAPPTRKRKSSGLFLEDIEGIIYEDYLSNKKKNIIE